MIGFWYPLYPILFQQIRWKNWEEFSLWKKPYFAGTTMDTRPMRRRVCCFGPLLSLSVIWHCLWILGQKQTFRHWHWPREIFSLWNTKQTGWSLYSLQSAWPSDGHHCTERNGLGWRTWCFCFLQATSLFIWNQQQKNPLTLYRKRQPDLPPHLYLKLKTAVTSTGIKTVS